METRINKSSKNTKRNENKHIGSIFYINYQYYSKPFL